MKTISLVLVLFFSHFCHAQMTSSSVPAPKEFGAGFTIGTISSITGKYWLSDRGAIDFGIGFVGSDWLTLYSDYLWHVPRVFGTNSKFGRESSLYFGGGGGLGFWHNEGHCGHWGCDEQSKESGTGVFIRGIVGVEWYAKPTRFGVFGELGPTIMLAPNSWGAFDISVGGRYYF